MDSTGQGLGTGDLRVQNAVLEGRYDSQTLESALFAPSSSLHDSPPSRCHASSLTSCRCQSLLEAIKEYQSQNSSLQSKVNHYALLEGELKSEVSRLERKLRTLEKKNDTCCDDTSKLASMVQSLTEDNAWLQQMADKVSQDLNKERAACAEATDREGKLRSMVEMLRSELQQAVVCFEKEVEDLRSGFVQEKKRLEHRVRELEREGERAEEEFAKLAKMYDEAKHALGECKGWGQKQVGEFYCGN